MHLRCALGGSLPSLLLWQTTCSGQLMKGFCFGWRFQRRVRNCRDSKAAGSWESPPLTSSTAECKPKSGPGCELSSPTSDELPQARLYFLDLPKQHPLRSTWPRAWAYEKHCSFKIFLHSFLGVFVYHVCAWYPWRSEVDVNIPWTYLGAGAMDVYEAPYRSRSWAQTQNL